MSYIQTPAFDSTTNSQKITEQDSLDQKFLSQTLASATSQPDGTYNYYLDMNGFIKLGLQFELTGSITVYIDGSVQDDGTAMDSVNRDYIDITTAISGSATITASGIVFDKDGVLGLCKYVRVRVVCAGGGTDAYNIYAKSVY